MVRALRCLLLAPLAVAAVACSSSGGSKEATASTTTAPASTTTAPADGGTAWSTEANRLCTNLDSHLQTLLGSVPISPPPPQVSAQAIALVRDTVGKVDALDPPPGAGDDIDG